MFVTLPKKANATECSDYRTLSLMSHLSKILLKEYGLSPEIHIKEEYDKDVCYHPVCLICTQKTSLEQ